MTTKTDKRLEREQRMYDALKRIAKDYMTLSQIRKDSGGALEYTEYLEMAYENIKAEAAYVIKGQRRPA